MTSIVANVMLGDYLANDLRLMEISYLGEYQPNLDNLPEAFWPGGHMLGGDISTISFALDAVRYEWCGLTIGAGSEGGLRISGVALDANGNGLGGATVKVYLTATDAFIASAIADSGGGFSVYTSYTGSHYCVAYLAGNPDVTGATVNTLTGV